jgi:hypothetical protein
MQNPTDQADTSNPTETTANNNRPNMNRTVVGRRKAANRTLPFYLTGKELNLVPSSPQAEDIPARKRPRLDEVIFASTDEAAAEISSCDTAVSLTASPDVSVGLPPPVADDDATNAHVVPVTDTQPNAGATTVARRC